MRRLLALLAAALCLSLASPTLGAGADPAEQLADPAAEARARSLFKEIRCLMCQNESIDDSHALIAGDLRKVIRQQISAGRSDDEVKAFLVERYGEFVLLKPRWSAGNTVLWIAPFLIVLAGVGALVARGRNQRSAEPLLSDEEAAALASLTADSDNGRKL